MKTAPGAEHTRVLVIGATGVAGTAAIRAVRRRHGDRAFIVGVTHEAVPDPSDPECRADRMLVADVADPGVVPEIAKATGSSLDLLFYAVARGDVGFPVNEASPEQIADADRVSFLPLLEFERRLHIGRSVGYSTFFTLRHQWINYGAMGHSKARLEEWVARRPGPSRTCIRAGAFPSPSSRAIKLLLRRNARTLAQSADPLLREFFDGRKPSEAVDLLERAVQEEERLTYGDTGTNADDLFQAHLTLLDHPEAIFVNVCGRRIWLSEGPLPL